MYDNKLLGLLIHLKSFGHYVSKRGIICSIYRERQLDMMWNMTGFSHVLLSCLHPRSCFAEYRLFKGILGMQLLMFFPQNATLLGDKNHNHSKMLIICCCKSFNIIFVQLTLFTIECVYWVYTPFFANAQWCFIML